MPTPQILHTFAATRSTANGDSQGWNAVGYSEQKTIKRT